MIDKNIFNFNPGRDNNTQQLKAFTDIPDLERQLKSEGIKFIIEVDKNTTGPANLMIADPDSNVILLDQHV
jgi:hypothetical protein